MSNESGDGLPFDMEFVVEHFSTTNLGFYLERIRSAPSLTLRRLKNALAVHRKVHVQNRAFANVAHLSTHDALIAAVKFELLKRSPWFSLWRISFPPRRLLASWLRGIDLKNDEYFGALPVQRSTRTALLHAPVSGVLRSGLAFWVTHWKILAPLAVATAALIVNWLKD
jgi:hypothetical protein